MPITNNYSDVMSEVKKVFTLAEIATATGVGIRQVSNWAAGSNRPRGEIRDRLLSLRSMVERLEKLLEPEGIDIWLHSPNGNLDWEAPVDLLAQNDFESVEREVERLAKAVR